MKTIIRLQKLFKKMANAFPKTVFSRGIFLIIGLIWIGAVSMIAVGPPLASAQTGGFQEGYNLFTSLNSTTAWLMDNDGNFVHSWETGYRPGNAMYLLENGELLHTGNVGNSTFNSGGAGGIVQKFDWQGNVTWRIEYSSSSYLQHHDVEPLPNGNVLMIAWQYKSLEEAIAAGRDPSLLGGGELWPDSVIEVSPTSSNTGEIVWQWHIWDHLVQDYDPSKPNFGYPADHPELIDLNHVMTNGGADWTHINAVDYNAELDQILLTVHNFSEIWVIDHGTTTEEAAGHSGGKQGKGGDLLYRWGNPEAYDTGGVADQQLFVPHDAEWIESGMPGEGNILIFNNGEGRPGGNYSSVDEIVPPVNEQGTYTLTPGIAPGPDQPVWSYTAKNPTDFFARNISGQQRLANGNTLICEGPSSYFFEVTDAGETVWEYDYTGAVFRVEHYSPDYSGFDGTVLDDGQDSSAQDAATLAEVTYPIVDTAQNLFYGDTSQISEPGETDAFYGQDAQFDGNQPSYTLSGDGLTVYDNVTGLTWTQSPDLDGDGDIDYSDKLTFAEAQSYPDILNAANFGGFNDWRLPSIKELYSLMDFRGTDPSGPDSSGAIPFIDTNYFAFGYGDESAGERAIDAQFWSSNEYVDYVFSNQSAAFGLNLADGRIKGYPTSGAMPKSCYVYFVRGNTDYGINDFTDNGDGTVTDHATGLMWSQDDSGDGIDTGPRSGMTWEEALAWVQQKNDENYLGYSDWRLPNAKEMQSILDYSRAPSATFSGAIDPVFNITQITNEAGNADYPWFWTGTTHLRANGSAEAGVYICFGRATGYMNGSWLDVHGAGAQRSDRKRDDFSGLTYTSDGYYLSMSPQGDANRIYNYARCVRDAATDNSDPADTDGDGTPDDLDGCPDDPDKTSPGTCGCGTPDSDSDSDGTPDCNDNCPDDPDKTDPGTCGCGTAETGCEVFYIAPPPTGDDTNNTGTTPVSPLATIQQAFNQASVSAKNQIVLQIAEGAYSESVVLNQAKTIKMNGGRGTSFATASSDSQIHGMISIQAGTVQCENLVVSNSD